MSSNSIFVIGLGAMGSATLYHLARSGHTPIGIEQFEAGHPYGSSYGHSRVFRSLYDKSIYIDMTQKSYPLWRNLESRSGEHLLTLNGMVFYGREGNKPLLHNLDLYQQAGLPHELLTPGDTASRFPALSVPQDAMVLYTPLAGFLDATRCVKTHVTMARCDGAVVYDDQKILHLDLDHARPKIHTQDESFTCDKLIITAGPWAASMLKEIGLPLQVTRQQKFYFRCNDQDRYLPARLPVYADYDSDFYGFPWYGRGIKVADDIHGQAIDPDQVDRMLDPEVMAQLKRWLEGLMPADEFTFEGGDTCMYTNTPDRDFVIGHHPDHPNVIIGAGFSGHGFKFSTFVGKLLADLAVDGTTDFPIEAFRPDRFEQPPIQPLPPQSGVNNIRID